MRPLGDPPRTVDYPFFAADLRGLPPSKTFIRSENDDPPVFVVALTASGATTAPSCDFLTMGAEGHSEFPPLSPNFEVWESGDRISQKDGKRE